MGEGGALPGGGKSEPVLWDKLENSGKHFGGQKMAIKEIRPEYKLAN